MMNTTKQSNGCGLLIHQIFENRAKESPTSIAVADPSTQTNWTYESINKSANALARRILTVTKGQLEYPVAILLNRRVDIIIASLATLKAGAAFIPLSLTYPEERITHILSQLAVHQPPIVIAEDEIVLNSDDKLTLKYVPFSCNKSNNNNNEGENENVSLDTITPSSLAYIIYTSGSTGVPKGVMVEHASLVSRLLSWFVNSYSITSSDRGTLLLNPAFDASLLESWGILSGGGTLYQLPESVRVDPSAFIEFVQTHSITRVVLPACFAERIWKLNPESSKLSSLKTMFVGGEQVSSSPSTVFSSLSYQVVNCYGPTETTVQATAMNLSTDPYGDELPPIGYPITGVGLQIREMDESTGEGELWIGGIGLARGYWNNAALTREKFVQEEITGRWYRSADIVRKCPKTGAFIWLRRMDDQVKVNGGFLVEPAEIERVILQQLSNQVSLAKVIVVDKRLVAFVVLNDTVDNKELDEHSNLKDQVAPFLPSYMLPHFFIVIPTLPTTPNGKVDKKALETEYSNFLNQIKISQPSSASSNNSDSSSSSVVNNLEKAVTSLWSRVLKLPETVVTATQDIFQIGGDSLHLSEMGALLKSQFGLELPANFLKGQSSLDVRKMAEMLASKMGQDNAPTLSPPSPPALVPLGGGGGGGVESPVYIFLHPEAGTLFCYNALLHRLANLGSGKGNYYGLQDCHVHNNDNLLASFSNNFSSVKEMAAYYVSILKQRFPPSTKFILSGYCFGGYLAWEMAALLENVPLLCIIDTDSNHNSDEVELDSLIRSYEASRLNNKGVKVSDAVVAIGSHRFQLGLRHHQPTILTKENQEILFFKSSSDKDKTILEEEQIWWEEFVGGGRKINFHDISADRESMLEEPNAPLIANAMCQYVNKLVL